MDQHNQDSSQGSSSGGKFLVILVVIAILGFVIFKLTSSETEMETVESSAPAPVAETPVTPDQDAMAEESVAEPAATEPVEAMEEKDETMAAAAIENPAPNLDDATKDNITAFLDNWKKAWEKSAGPNGDHEKLYSFYADNFTSGKMSKEAWRKSKTIRNQGKTWIEVWLSDIKISQGDEGQYVVSFKQEYSSSNYSDKSSKVMTLAATDDSFVITSEKSVD